MKFGKTRVMNFEGAFRGLRNPLQSWGRSDSFFALTTYPEDYGLQDVAYQWVYHENQLRQLAGNEPYESLTEEHTEVLEKYMDWLTEQGILCDDGNAVEVAYLGPKDLDLAQRMIRAGSSDRKFMRQIMVSVDITGPLYWWKQFDTYKVGTVANSTSTMHKLASTPITMDCFETDDFQPDLIFGDHFEDYIFFLEKLRQRYLQTKDKRYWKELIRWLPESWLQTRTVTMNYQVLRNIYSQRKNHKLSEWHQFCDWIKTLPYAKELITHNLD